MKGFEGEESRTTTGSLARWWETLEEGLSRLRGRPVRIPELLREPLPSISSFHRERLRVTLDGGKTLRVFFKDLNPEHQTEKARTVRTRDLAPSLRELRMYQSVLSPQRDGTLYLYAFRWEPERGLYWIFLEDGGRTVAAQLRRHGPLDRGRSLGRQVSRSDPLIAGCPDGVSSSIRRSALPRLPRAGREDSAQSRSSGAEARPTWARLLRATYRVAERAAAVV